VRDYEIRNGIAFPSHIQSTVDTRIVGRAELEINFSNFTREDSAGDDATSDVSSNRTLHLLPCNTHKRRNQSALSKKSTRLDRPRGPSYKEIVSIAQENAVSESTLVSGL